MNKRHAKRWANTHAAIIIEIGLGKGFPWNENFSDKDTNKICDAFGEIINSLHKKGLYKDDPPISQNKNLFMNE